MKLSVVLAAVFVLAATATAIDRVVVCEEAYQET